MESIPRSRTVEKRVKTVCEGIGGVCRFAIGACIEVGGVSRLISEDKTLAQSRTEQDTHLENRLWFSTYRL